MSWNGTRTRFLQHADVLGTLVPLVPTGWFMIEPPLVPSCLNLMSPYESLRTRNQNQEPVGSYKGTMTAGSSSAIHKQEPWFHVGTPGSVPWFGTRWFLARNLRVVLPTQVGTCGSR